LLHWLPLVAWGHANGTVRPKFQARWLID